MHCMKNEAKYGDLDNFNCSWLAKEYFLTYVYVASWQKIGKNRASSFLRKS